MAELFYTLLEMSLRGSYVILILLAVRLLLRRAPRRFICLLWIAAFFRLVCPISVSSAFSLIPAQTLPLPQALSGTVWSSEPVYDYTQGYVGVSQTSVTLIQVLAALWLIGAVGMAAASLVSLWRLRRSLRSAVRTADGAWEAAGLPTAFIVGLFRPRIYLPAGLPDGEREMVLRHERIHLRRADPLLKLAAHLILCLHWFNPLVWLAFRLLCRDIEIACDEQVVQELGETQAGAYSRTLLHLAGGTTHSGALAFAEGGVEGRIRHLLSRRKMAAAVTVLCAVLMVVLGAALVLDPADPRPQWLRRIESDQPIRAELISADNGQITAAWFEGTQLDALAKTLAGAKADTDESGLSQELLDSARQPQMDVLYLLMEDGSVHTVTAFGADEAKLMIDGVSYAQRDGWEEIWRQEGSHGGISQEMAGALAAQQEVLDRAVKQLRDSYSHDPESGELSFVVPQALAEGEVSLTVTGQTEDGQEWQDFAEENRTQNWAAGSTYTRQAGALTRLSFNLWLNGSSAGMTADSAGGYVGISTSNAPVEAADGAGGYLGISASNAPVE